MFQFGYLSVNVFYIVFAAIYLASVGFFSINKLAGRQSDINTAERDQSKTIIVNSLEEDKPGISFHYSDYYFYSWESNHTISHPVCNLLILLTPDKIPVSLLDFRILSRPPPPLFKNPSIRDYLLLAL